MPESWDVVVPTWRARDVTREVDVVEEIARVHLDEIPFTLPSRSGGTGRLSREQRLRRLAEDALVGAGFDEAYTWSLYASDPNPEALRLPEPLSADEAVLRTTLIPGLVGAVQRNLDAGNEGIALFELARVYFPSGEQLPDERRHLGGIAEGGFGRAKGAVEALFAALRLEPRVERTQNDFLHPGKAAAVQGGWLGELHPSLLEGTWGAFELDLDELAELAPGEARYAEVSAFPPVRQDLAFVVDEDVLAGDLVAAAREAAPELVEARVFDVYRGGQIAEGRKSVALRGRVPGARPHASTRTRRGRSATASSPRSSSASAPSCAPESFFQALVGTRLKRNALGVHSNANAAPSRPLSTPALRARRRRFRRRGVSGRRRDLPRERADARGDSGWP